MWYPHIPEELLNFLKRTKNMCQEQQATYSNQARDGYALSGIKSAYAEKVAAPRVQTVEEVMHERLERLARQTGHLQAKIDGLTHEMKCMPIDEYHKKYSLDEYHF
jgi:hypothetical protein